MNQQYQSEYNQRVAKKAAERRAKMVELRKQGKTLEEIGRRFGKISRQRVKAILGDAA